MRSIQIQKDKGKNLKHKRRGQQQLGREILQYLKEMEVLIFLCKVGE